MNIFFAPFYYLIFLLPGFALSIYLKKKQKLEYKEVFIVSNQLSFLVAYFYFFIFFWNLDWGYFLVYTTSFLALIFCFKNINITIKYFRNINFELILLFSVYFLYISITYIVPESVNVRFTWPLPNDNQLPWSLTDCIVKKNYFVKECFQNQGFWTSSDRPPIFSAIILYLIPFKLHDFSDADFYQNVGTLIQSLWICGAFFLAISLGWRRSHITFFMLSLIFSGFSLLNTVFLWPKMITILPFAFAYKILIIERRRSNELTFRTALGFASVSIAFLLHGGILFSLISLFLIWGFREIFLERKFSRFYSYFLGLLVSLFLIVPWTMYQKLYDPPGDHLMKMRIAGQRNSDDPILYRNHPMLRERQPLLDAIIESYSVVPEEDILKNKLENIRTAFYLWIPDFRSFPNSLIDLVKKIRELQFFYTFSTSDFLIFGLFGIPFTIFKGNSKQNKNIVILFSIFLLSMWLWIMIMFEPRGTVIHQGSYMNVIFLFILTNYGFFSFPLIRWVFLLLHIGIFFFWIPEYNFDAKNWDWYYINISIISFIFIPLLLGRKLSFNRI